MIQEEIDALEEREKERIAYIDRVLPEKEVKRTRYRKLFMTRMFYRAPKRRKVMIDRYDAPDEMIAVRCNNEYDLCEGCHYYSDMLSLEGCDRRCGDLNRLDNTDVIFVTRADFEKMLLQEIEQFYGKGKIKRIIFTKANIKQDITQKL